MRKKFAALVGLLCAAMSLNFCLSSCAGRPDDSKSSGDSVSEDSTPSEDSANSSGGSPETWEIEYNTSYAPVYFDGGSVTNTVTRLEDGVYMVANRVTLNNSTVAIVYTIEIDLSKAEIHAGTVSNKRSNWYPETATPYSMMTAYEKDSGKKALATVNADFFGATCLNALVKDGCILKDGHTITSTEDYEDSYLYTDLKADVPASAPMLFGVNGKGEVQIAPIVSYEGDVTSVEVKKKLVTSKLSYELTAKNKTYEICENNTAQDVENTVIFHTSSVTKRKFPEGSIVYKVDIKDNYTDMAILEKTVLEAAASYKATASEGYIVVDPSFAGDRGICELEAGDSMTVQVTSDDGTWRGYETILGCRQTLVMDGEMAYTYKNGEKLCTVTLENTNGAQSENVPRTAVGVKGDGTLVVFAVESLRYGSPSVIKDIKEDDSYGLNLPQLADFMIYYGIETGANFDGGGSTQLIARQGADAQPEVIIRSSDTGSYTLAASRKVMNTLMVTTK